MPYNPKAEEVMSKERKKYSGDHTNTAEQMGNGIKVATEKRGSIFKLKRYVVRIN